MEASHITSEKILDTAVYLAEKSSWENLRFLEIAQHLEIELTDIYIHFHEKNDLINAFFDRADKAMLTLGSQSEIIKLTSEERLAKLLYSWFSNIQQHRQVAREMIWSQLEPGHLHIQLPILFRISRTVQWWREAARRSATYWRRAIEETGLTAIYLTTFMYWLYDDSKEAIDTRQFIEKQLARAHCLKRFCKNSCSTCSDSRAL